MSRSDLPPVLVLDAQTRQGLAACRALGRAGVEVGAASADAAALSRSSRHVARFHRLDPGLAGVEALVGEHGYGAIVACEDPTVALLAAEPPAAATVPTLDASLDALVDKLRLAATAASAGVGYPTTVPLADAADVRAALAELGSPMIVKASRSAAVVDGDAIHRSGARVVHDVDEAERAVDWIAGGGLTPIAQRRVERADKVDVAVVRRDGGSEVRLAYRVLRDVPLSGGLAVAVESIPADDGNGRTALDDLERLLDAAGYEGIANAEFCVSGDGSVTLIEVNTRVWASIWFAERLGLRVVERTVRQALGLPRLGPPPHVPPGRRYRNPAGEIDWILRHERRLRPLATVVRDLPRRSVLEYVDVSDPRPPLVLGLDKLRARVARRRTS
jgi:predicted ATP-grasp superfamily ATP-dependent carboligase